MHKLQHEQGSLWSSDLLQECVQALSGGLEAANTSHPLRPVIWHSEIWSTKFKPVPQGFAREANERRRRDEVRLCHQHLWILPWCRSQVGEQHWRQDWLGISWQNWSEHLGKRGPSRAHPIQHQLPGFEPLCKEWFDICSDTSQNQLVGLPNDRSHWISAIY